MKRLSIIAVLLSGVLSEASAQLPVRYWSDDMARHNFSLGLGPGWFTETNPVLNIGGLQNEDITPVSVEVALRYDWSYLRGYEVALGVGATYIFSTTSSRTDGGVAYGGDIKRGDAFHYIGVNAVNTRMWFGKRTIWDVSIHTGYVGGRSWTKIPESRRESITENGFMAGMSTGLDFLITAWLGIGVHLNAMSGLLYDEGSSREYTHASVRIGAVYCF